MKRQSGFTLVEIAIVLVIVGLLLAGIIQGSALINSGTAKNLANELKTIPVYVYQYQDKFRALPGDDRAANAHVNGLNPPAASPGNGRIDGAWDIEDGVSESAIFWEHIRKAHLAAGPDTIGAAGYYPTNVAGGRIGVSSVVPITGMSGSYFVCSGGVLGKYVKQMDTTLDDGNTAQGSVRAALVTAPGTAVATIGSADESQSYNVCMGF
jgi:prepilin-type N-terminal cleavage/methylation domain-containing protein